MDFVTLFLTSLGLAMDAFSVSITSGIFIKNMKWKYALKIGIFFGLFQFMMPCIGWLMGCGFHNIISRYSPWIAFGLLGFVGGKMLFETVHPKEKEIANPLDNKLLLVMAIATSIDALAVGITYAAMDMTFLGNGIINGAFGCSVIIGFVAFFMSAMGVYIGNKSGDLFGNKAEIAGGIVLIGIGLKILLEGIL